MALISSKQVETNRTELTIEAKGPQFKQAVDRSFIKNAKKIALPGFRKGKAPRAMIEKLYGREMFYEDAVNELYPEAYAQAVREAGIEPVDEPRVEMLDLDDEGFSFKATVTTKPQAVLGAYKGLKAVRGGEEVTDAEIDEQLLARREQSARLVTAEGRTAREGDVAHIDFEGFDDGVAFEGGKGENHPLTLGSGSFIPGFEEQIVGRSAGEEFDVHVTFPEEYGEPSLAGKPVVFKVRLGEIREKQYPEMDDEFAKDVSEFDTLDEYKADLRAKLSEQKRLKAESDFESRLIEQVVEGMQVEIPQVMIDERIRELVQEFGMRMSAQGLRMEDFLRYSGEDEHAFHENFRPQAERHVKTRLAMEAVAKAEGLTAAPEELDAEYQKLSEQYKTDAERLRTLIPANELQMDIACRKALDFIVQNAEAQAPQEQPAEAPAKKPAAKKSKPAAADEAPAEEPRPKKRAAKKPAETAAQE